MYDFSAFSSRLKKSIDEKGYTQVEVAQHLGISKHTLTKYLGGRIPETTILYALSKFFNKSMEWFLTGEDNIYSTIEPSKDIQKIETIFDPDLKRMVDVLKCLMENDNQNLRGWAIIQFEEAFKQHCAAHDKKKLHA